MGSDLGGKQVIKVGRQNYQQEKNNQRDCGIAPAEG